MADEVYERLARHLDGLPGGFPRTASGVELRILRRLFTPDDAALALHLTLIPEQARVVARRAGIATAEASRRLGAMEKKGLITTLRPEGRTPQHMAAQFVIGIWEYQVKRLTPELVREFEEYLPALIEESWPRVPQLRTIPVGKAITTRLEVMPYERAEELVRAQRTFAVAPCICRQERRVAGEGCDKPLETCLTFGGAAESYQRNGRGRTITRDEALDLLKQAEEVGLVLQPGNARDAVFICMCCGCCCGVLRTLKRHPEPATLVWTPFVAASNPATCSGCGTCTERCPMEAVTLDGGVSGVQANRCIGCGLCVTTCPTDSIALVRKPASAQRRIPRDIVDTSIRLAQARGRLGWTELIGMQVRSKLDRVLARWH